MSKVEIIIPMTPPLDEAVWQAWLAKNLARDKVRFERRVWILGAVSAGLVLGAILRWLSIAT